MPDLKEKLKATEARLGLLRDERALKAKARDAAREVFAADPDSKKNPNAMKNARAAVDALGEVDVRIEEARRDQISLLKQIGQVGPSSPGGLDQPGAWLAHAIRNVKLLPPGESLRGGGGAMALTTTGAGLGDAVTPPQFIQAFFDRLAPRSVGLLSGFTILPIDGNSVRVPRLTGDPAADWTAEGSNLPLVDLAGDQIEVTPKKLGGVVEITKEAWQDPEVSLLAVSEYALMRDISLKLDLGFYEGNPAVDADQIRGLKNTPGIASTARAVGEDALTVIGRAIGMLLSANAAATAIVVRPEIWTEIVGLREDAGVGLTGAFLLGSPAEGTSMTLWGIPVYVSSQLAAADLGYVYDAPQIVAVRRQDAEVAFDPFFGFRAETVGLRVTVRYGIAVPNPTAVVAMDNAA